MSSSDFVPYLPAPKRARELFQSIAAHVVALTQRLSAIETWRVLLTFVSAATTWYGMVLLYDVLGTDHGSGSIGLLRFVIPLAMAGSLHAAIFRALHRWIDLGRLSYLCLAIPLQIVAVIASYNTHWVHMRGGSETEDSYITAQTAIVRGIGSFVASYRSLADETAALADHSKTQAEIENRDGTSCGTTAGHGKWVRWDLRMADRDTFASYNQQVGGHLKRLQELNEHAGASTAASANDAMAKLPDLRRIVNDAKTFETDPLLQSLRKVTQDRIALGKGPIEIPPAKRRKDGERTFTCPDGSLERHLQAVLDAIGGLKPVPEVDVRDARNPQVGLGLLLPRLWNSVVTLRIAPPSREQLKDARKTALSGKADISDGLRRADIPPLAVAIVIEVLLTLLFWIGGGSLPLHPGISTLRECLRRSSDQIIPRIWAALGGQASHDEVRRILDQHVKFDDSAAFILVPLYSDQSDDRTLHHVMELLVHAGLAKRYYTGRRLVSLFAIGWHAKGKAMAKDAVSLRIYRMAESDYLAFILDSLDHEATYRHDANSFVRPRNFDGQAQTAE